MEQSSNVDNIATCMRYAFMHPAVRYGLGLLYVQINYSSAELAVEWLMAHPEDPAAASSTAADATAKDADEDAIKKQVMDVLGPDETPPERLEVRLHLLC